MTANYQHHNRDEVPAGAASFSMTRLVILAVLAAAWIAALFACAACSRPFLGDLAPAAPEGAAGAVFFEGVRE